MKTLATEDIEPIVIPTLPAPETNQGQIAEIQESSELLPLPDSPANDEMMEIDASDQNQRISVADSPILPLMLPSPPATSDKDIISDSDDDFITLRPSRSKKFVLSDTTDEESDLEFNQSDLEVIDDSEIPETGDLHHLATQNHLRNTDDLAMELKIFKKLRLNDVMQNQPKSFVAQEAEPKNPRRPRRKRKLAKEAKMQRQRVAAKKRKILFD